MAQVEPIRMGIAGLGRSGWSIHAKTLQTLPDRYRVVAVADLDQGRQAEARETFGCRSYGDFESLAADEEVEVLVVATPNRYHTEHSIAALEAGHHVISEKPFALTLADADREIATAERVGRILAPFHNRRYEPHFQKVLEIVNSGLLGRILEVRLAWHSFSRRWDWQTLLEYGSGLLANNGPHILDHACHFLGEGDVRIFADLQRGLASGDAEDHAKVVLKAETGPTVDVELTTVSAYPAERWQVMGTSGGLVGTTEGLRWKWVDWSTMPERPVDTRPTPDRSYNREKLTWQEETWTPPADLPPENRLFYEDFYRTVREGQPLFITPQSVRRYVSILETCRRQYAEQVAGAPSAAR